MIIIVPTWKAIAVVIVDLGLGREKLKLIVLLSLKNLQKVGYIFPEINTNEAKFVCVLVSVLK